MRSESIIFANPNRQAIISKGPTITPVGDICDFHVHQELEFLYILSGSMKLALDNLEFIGNAGDIMFINSNFPHMTQILDSRTEIYLIQFRNPSILKNELKYLSKFLKQQSVPAHVFSKDDSCSSELLTHIKSMIEFQSNKDISSDFYITSNIYSIIAMLYKKGFFIVEENIVNPKLINKVLPIIQTINENYKEHLTLDTLAKLSSFNKEYLCRLFKRATGTTLTDYLNFVRVCKAEELFKTDTNISEISYMTGFSSLSYFNKIFKRYKHHSPTAYRKIYSNSDMK